jgi:hypothetical protein
MTMPPDLGRWEGAPALGHFFATEPMEGQLHRIALRPARANRQPALAAYADGAPYGVMVFALQDGRIAGITGYAQMPHLFVHLGLPTAHPQAT